MTMLPKPTYADILRDNCAANNSSTATGRVDYHETGDFPLMDKRDPCYVDYEKNLIGIHGDGNCMFRAIAFAVSNPDLGHAELRRKVCDAEAIDSDLKEALGDSMGDFDERLTHMRKPGEWGGEPELLTASRVVQRQIFVWTNGACLAPYGESDHPAIHLSYENNVHYNLFIVDPRSVSQYQATVSDGEHCVVQRVQEAPSGAGKCSANEHHVLEAPSVADKCTVSKTRGGRPKKKGFRQPSKRRTGVDIDVPEATEAAQQNDDELVMHTAAAISGHVDHLQICASESGSAADAVALPDDGNNSKCVNANTSKAPEPETTDATDADVEARGCPRKRKEFKQTAKRQNCEENDVPETDCNHHEKRLRSAIEDTSRETVSSVAVSKGHGGRPKKKGFRQPSKRRTGVDIDVPEATEAAQKNDDQLVMHTAAAISGHADHPQIWASESGSAADAVALPDGNNSKCVNDNTSKAPEPETTNATDADVKARGRPRKRKEFKQPAKRQNCEENDVPEATSTAKQNDVQPVMDTECDAATNFESCCVDNPQMRPAPFDSTADTAVVHGDGNVSVPPSAGLSVSNRADGCGVAILMRTTLDGYAANTPHSIVIESVETDLCSSSERGLDGPWSYRNSHNVSITYAVGDCGEKRLIRLTDLERRGFCAPSRAGQLRYNMYSWLRFKEIVRKSGRSVSTVLGDEGLFHDTLCQVDRYYCRHRRYADQEGLQPHRGPQTWDDRHNLLQLHYYGKGRLKYFRLATLREMFSSRYGADRFAEFRADPWTDTLTEDHFEQLLIDVHIELRDKHYRYTRTLEPFAGPQCHEDRGTSARMEYNVLFVTRAAGSGRGARRNRRPVAEAPPQRVSLAAAVDTTEPRAFFLRTCVDCGTLRILDASAAAKYPLGRYTYADREQHVIFTCDRLVGIACDTPPDFVACAVHDKPSTWVAMGTQPVGDHLPPPAIQLRSLRVLDASDHTEETQVVGSYCHRNDRRASGFRGCHSLFTRTTNSGIVTLGTMSKRRRFHAVPGCRFTAGRFTVDVPREAKCCQPWHDPSDSDPEDPSAKLGVTNLQVLRDIHAVYDSLRRVRCIKCNQQTPGLPYQGQHVKVPERGVMTDLSANGVVSQAVAKSAILCGRSTVTLDPKFRGAGGTLLSDRFAKGVCTVCSPSYDVDSNHIIVPRPLMPDIGLVQADANDDDDFVDAEQSVVHDERGALGGAPPDDDEHELPPTHINMYSAQNLVSTDVYSDVGYELFVRTWTRAETMVLRSVHLLISVMRLRANNVPFSKHGSICYPLKVEQRALNLPWYDFERLPFVVIVQRKTDGTSTQAMVNIDTIRRAKEYMERSMPCMYNPGQVRPFYRFVASVPFSNENLDKLFDTLSRSDGPRVPAGLRVLEADDINGRAHKALRIQEFCNWLESGFEMAKALWSNFSVSCAGVGADESEATQLHLWQVMESYVMRLRERDNGDDESDTDEIEVTMRNVVECAIENGWLLSTTVDENAGETDTNQPSVSTLLRCCEELEILGREFGNDEGGATGVAVGAAAGLQTERPEDIRQQGIARTALRHISMPAADRENPLPECTPGYMPRSFPEVLRSGDADPYQDRPLSIRQPMTTWRLNYLRWMARQPEAEGNVDFQFVVGSQVSRDICGQDARVAIRSTDFPDGLPTKDQLMNDPALCRRVAQSLLFLQSKLEDSDAFWRMVKQEMIGVIRYLEDPPPWRDDIPMEVFLWQTRAVPYNHHPAIHRLCDNAAVSEALSDERYLNNRLANTLKHPGIVSWVAAFMGELDTLAMARARYGASHYMVRSEWGANANPHIHRHIISETFSKFLQELQKHLTKERTRIEAEVRADDPTLERDVSRSAIDTRLEAVWRACQQRYIARISQFYTNWNAGFTKDGERTYDFAYDRKTTVCRAQMATMLDEAMTSGNFATVDDLYVRVINGTLRHTGHSGRGDAPSAKDGCAVRRRVVDKVATEEARAAGRARATVKKDVIVCKRRMPRRLRTDAAVVPDAHDPRIMQCETSCNDPLMGGHDPFTVLHFLNNIDDKAIVPGWLARPPRVEWKHVSTDGGGYQFDVVLAEASGDGSVEYALKYGFKPVAPVKTPGNVLLTALERREGGDNVDHGVVKRMYTQVAASTCQSIFQIVHKNWQLPLLLKNVAARDFSLSGTRMLKPVTADADPVYVFAGTIERFDARLADNVSAPDNIPLDAFQCAMSVFKFYDQFSITEKTHDGQTVFHIRRRYGSWGDKRNCIRLRPHHNKSNANPARDQFWKYARDIVLWHMPCYLSLELMPHTDCVTDDAIAAHWRSMYDQLLASDFYVPKWVRRYHTEYHSPAEEAENEVSDESDDGHESDGAVGDVAAVFENDDERDLHAARVGGRFYQTALDEMQDQCQIRPLETETVAIVGIGGREAKRRRDNGCRKRDENRVAGRLADLGVCKDRVVPVGGERAQRDRGEPGRVEGEDDRRGDRRKDEDEHQQQPAEQKARRDPRAHAGTRLR